MKAHAFSFTSGFSSSFTNRKKSNFPLKKPAFTFLCRNSRFCNLLHPLRKPNYQVVEGVRFDGPVIHIDEIEDSEDGELVFEHCVTRTLSPALTLEEGLERIKDAVEMLKLDPPCSTSGIFRFRVVVPPSPKALNWFCCQPESSGVFPLFFLSKNKDNPTCKSLHLNGSRGIFAIGAAVYFAHSSSVNSEKQSSIKRYISIDSTFIMAYGFVDINFDSELVSMSREAGSYYFFIPQIELDEQETLSALTATVAWDNSSLTFKEALHCLECSLDQVIYHVWPTTNKRHSKSIRSTLRKLNLVEDGSIPMVYMNMLSVEGREHWNVMALKDSPSYCQFCFRISPTVTFARNMLDPARKLSYLVQENANINAVWASLIIEECARLGLTYFCVAPGSRSSPLAIAASTHQLVTCISCYDERSLAFHAVGYSRGSHSPAVVITSSGTAVSNLLPAVVEASQDFVPLILLTADRPPELQDVGANQAINQVNHFGSFVRFSFSLPTPTDQLPARLVLTTLDSAVHWATSSTRGPVHINCPFREPLENSPRMWMRSCLKGLDFWMSGAEPFTKYIHMQRSHAYNNDQGKIMEVLNLIQGANHGLLLIGAIHTEDEIWAALLLAKHLLWPVVADILSGLRLRKLLASFPGIEGNFIFVDHLDHALLSDSVRAWIETDVVVQIGSRITSKRISQMLENCITCSYVMVDQHPYRHDPTHIVTHRIQSTIAEFAGCLLKANFPRNSKWSTSLHVLSKMVEQEILFQICLECSLTEPQVAHVITEALSVESALFLGNSMVIRDADMYGRNWSTDGQTIGSLLLNSNLPCHWIQVVGNRGVSGIDGLLSTAVGFAVGCNKKVLCVIGDVSLLHDTNGLAILSQRKLRKPMTILVINNHGGAIFSLLPIADKTEPTILHQYFYTSHNISIQGLCVAHGVKHLHVQTKLELEDALSTTQHEEIDCVIEIESSIDANANFHRLLKNFALQTAENTLRFLPGLSDKSSINNGFFLYEIHKMEYSVFRIALCAPPTTVTVDHNRTEFYREGYILSLFLEEGAVGFGEVAPLEIHRENLVDVEEQLRFLIHVMKGARISCFLPLLKGSFSDWIWNELGIQPSSVFPSVRCGLEMAILNAIAQAQGSSLFDVLYPMSNKYDISEKSTKIQICALLDSNGSPAEVAHVARTLVEEGFIAIKLKVARWGSPVHSGEVIKEVRKKVGPHIEIRADANRNWTYEEAIEFSYFVGDCNLQYIEEPVQDEDDILKFCEESGLPVALDETIDNIQENLLKNLVKYKHPRIVAIVIKPSVVGGFENALLIARWAQQLGKLAVVSATFESGLGLSAYIQFSCYLEMQNRDICKVMNDKTSPSIAHGLGTYRWLKEDVTTYPLKIVRNPYSGFVEASVADASQLMHDLKINQRIICRSFTGQQIQNYQLNVQVKNFSCSFKVQEIGQITDDNILVFLHGFLGTGEDWISIMKALSGSARCIAVDLPGHGGSTIQSHGLKDGRQAPCLSLEIIADALLKLINHITPGKVIFVGYSMGARIALYMALNFSDKTKGAVIVSGSPGLKDKLSRKIRMAKDDSKARILVAHGLELFLDTWYAGELWESLRGHPHFNKIVASRLQHSNVQSLAKVLSDLSVGRQPPLWEDLKNCKTPFLFIVGEKDTKFKKISEEMIKAICHGIESRHNQWNYIHDMVEIPNSGHAAHLENPLPVITALRKFLTRL
ncbi:protein PHYLLO, chloroplastic [Quillaja saponaria]|uniref:Protein PHYLLO, chloroplastic n=1 Tax=Quillaja saponaria TaxID=32244 RepID=A0AAD7KPH5_QUISA|nr:protein PHYLLO, chloroplastic [Quillaja saponaria]